MLNRSPRCLWCDVSASAGVTLRPRRVAANGAPCWLCRVCLGEIEQYPLPLLTPKTADQLACEKAIEDLQVFRGRVVADGPAPFSRAGIPFGFVHVGQGIDGAIADLRADVARYERRRSIPYRW